MPKSAKIWLLELIVWSNDCISSEINGSCIGFGDGAGVGVLAVMDLGAGFSR